jgi:hypothetical protein
MRQPKTFACAAAIALGCFVHQAHADPTEQFTIAGRFVPPAAAAGDERSFTDAIAWMVPVSEVAALFGLTLGNYDWRYPDLAVNVWLPPGERARVEAFAKAWAYVYRQAGVPYFRTPESGTSAMRLRYEESLVPAQPWQPGIEARLATLRARYDRTVSRWLSLRPKGLSL